MNNFPNLHIHEAQENFHSHKDNKMVKSAVIPYMVILTLMHLVSFPRFFITLSSICFTRTKKWILLRAHHGRIVLRIKKSMKVLLPKSKMIPMVYGFQVCATATVYRRLRLRWLSISSIIYCHIRYDDCRIWYDAATIVSRIVPLRIPPYLEQ